MPSFHSGQLAACRNAPVSSNVRPRSLKRALLHHRKAKIMADFKWKDSEKKAANRAYEKARVAELDELIHSFKTGATKISDPDQLSIHRT